MSDDVAGSLIDALADEGEAVDEGRFTLDPRAAQRKLRAHQLSNPLAYVLLLVEAAHLGGSDAAIAFELGLTTKVGFAGPCLSEAELVDLFGAVFGRRDALPPEQRARAEFVRALGLAANAALAAGARHVRVFNVDDEGRTRGVSLTTDEPPRTLDAGPEGPPGRTVFEFHDSVLELARAARERELLAERCRYASVPITVDGERIDEGIEAAFASFRRIETAEIALGEFGRHGAAAHRPMAEPARALILTRGVIAESIELDGCRPGFLAVVDVDLRKDLSQRRVVRDASFEAVLAAIEQAHAQLPSASDAVRRDGDEPIDWQALVVVALIVASGLLLVVLALIRGCSADAWLHGPRST